MFYVSPPGLLPPATLKHGAPSWVAELEDDDPDQAPAQVRELNYS